MKPRVYKSREARWDGLWIAETPAGKFAGVCLQHALCYVKAWYQLASG